MASVVFGRSAWLVAVALASLASSAAAQAVQPASLDYRWAVHGGAHRCVISRLRPEPFEQAFSIRKVPGFGFPELIIARPGEAGLRFRTGDRFELILDHGARHLVKAQEARLPEGRALQLFLTDGDFIADLSRSSHFTLHDKRGGSVRFDFTNASGAVGIFNQCITQTLGRWGIDPNADQALRSGPQLTDPGGWTNWLRSSDYPRDALRAGDDGTVVYRLSIDETGKVTGCQVMASSGSEALDSVTCRLAPERLRFRPALDSEGRSVESRMIGAVSFQIAERP